MPIRIVVIINTWYVVSFLIHAGTGNASCRNAAQTVPMPPKRFMAAVRPMKTIAEMRNPFPLELSIV
jgi:hypothetical protein